MIDPANHPRLAFTWRTALALAGGSLFLRAILLAVYFEIKPGSWSVFLSHSDAASFLRMSDVLVFGSPSEQLSFYDHRAFPGWPVVIGFARIAFPDWLALLGPSLLFSTVVPVVVFRLTQSIATAIAVMVMPPVWLLSSTYPMAEPLFLAAALASLLAAAQNRWVAAGLLGAIACITKPYGIFLAAGLAWAAIRQHGVPFRWRPPVTLFCAALVPVIAVGILNVIQMGSIAPAFAVYAAPLEQLNLPSDRARLLGSAVGHWSWPFDALINTPRRIPTPAWKTIYVYAHLIGAIVLTVRGLLRGWRSTAPWHQACVIWLVGNTAASLCAGPYWGFHAFDRYVLWAWPAAVLLNRDWFGPRPVLWLGGGFSLLAATYSILVK